MGYRWMSGINFAILAGAVTAACGGEDPGRLLARAEALQEQKLWSEAKVSLVSLLGTKLSDEQKAKALDMLARIALEQNDAELALVNWNRLVAEVPTSPEAEKIKPRLAAFTSVVSELRGNVPDDPIARTYLRNANFWASERNQTFQIDTSWIDNVDSAVKWYDLAIEEFRGAPAGRIAYEQKLFTLMGWRPTSQYDEGAGLRTNPGKYLPLIVETFRAFETAYPDAASLPAFRYQIAQAYWRQKNWEETRSWLQQVVTKEGAGNSFYKDLAERRLAKIEY